MEEAPITQRDLANAVQAATLSTQMTEVIKDIAELKNEIISHRIEHDRNEQRRKNGQRWIIGIIIAAIAAIDAPTIVIYLVTHP